MARIGSMWLVVIAIAYPSLGSGQTLGLITDRFSGSVLVFDADTDVALGTVVLPGTRVRTADCSISADGTLAFVSDGNHQIWVIDLPALALADGPNPIEISTPGYDTSISSDGRFLVTCGDFGNTVSVVNVDARAEVSTWRAHFSCGAIEICSDRSVLVSDDNGSVIRLEMDDNGGLVDTGELLNVRIPSNVSCAPNAASGVVLSSFYSRFESFTLPGLASVASHTNFGTLSPISGLFNESGDRYYVRSDLSIYLGDRGYVEAYDYDPETAEFSYARRFFTQRTVQKRGVDQMALHPDGTKLYTSVFWESEVGVFDLNLSDHTANREIRHRDIESPFGICLPGSLQLLAVEIDVKPESDSNAVNPASKGVIPVAILGSGEFDVGEIDVTTLRFGSNQAAPAHKSGGHASDVNEDGFGDWISHYRTLETGHVVEDTEICLRGETLDHRRFEGCDSIRTP